MSNHINNRIPVVKNDKQEKSSNPFLNPIKRENPTLNKEEKTNRFNSKPTTENSNKTDNIPFNNDFKERNYQNKNNMFKDASNNKRNDSNTTNKDNNFSLDNEEMFPSLGNKPIKVQVQDQETKPVLSYKTVSETQKTEINKNNEKTLKNGWLSLSKGQDISKLYKKEAELRNKRESMKALSELSKQRIEEIKASYEYNYIWNEEKRNEMLYGITKDELNNDDYSDDQDNQYEDDDNYNYYNKKYSYDN